MTLDEWISVVEEFGLEQAREHRIALALIEVAKAARMTMDCYAHRPNDVNAYLRGMLSALDKELGS